MQWRYLEWGVPVLVMLLLGVLSFLIKNKPARRALRVLFVLALLAGLAYGGYRIRQLRAQVDPLAGGEVYTVTRGEISEVVEATGNLAPAAQVNLTFSIPGELVEITVSTGDAVHQGDLLARLDTADLERQLAQAAAGVAIAQANLDKLQAEPRPEDVTTAQSSLNQALANLEELRVTLSAATEQARLSWEQAANNLRDAQAAYENIYWDNRELEDRLKKYDQELPDANVDAEAQAWRAVENAEAAMEQARLNYEQARQREETSLQAAYAQVASAQANLDRLLNGVMPTDVAGAEASLEQAQVNYESAQAQLEKAFLKAPFEGVVATVLAEEHAQVSAATPVLVLIDPSAYYLDVQVDEVDISLVQVGQRARLFFDALPEVELAGQVTEVALSPDTSGGVVTYRVRIQIDEIGDVPVRPGMTANAHIITRTAEDVLVIPRRAVRLVDGQAYVDRVVQDPQTGQPKLEEVPVEIGLEDPFSVEVVSGLKEGDQVFVRGVVQQNQIQQFFGRPGG